MKNPGILNRLPFRIVAPIVAALLLAGVCLNLAISYVTGDYTARIISDSLEKRATAISSIMDENMEALVKGGQSDDEKAQRIKMAYSIAAIEEDMRYHGMDGAVFKGHNTVLLQGSLAYEIINSAGREIAANKVTAVRYGGKRYYIYYFEFEPWGWRIYLIRDETEYAELINRVNYAYLFTGLLLLALVFLFIFHLNRTIKAPLNMIIERLKQGDKPDYRGIYEFEFLSSNIGSILDSLHGETERLNIIYHIAITKRGKEFFNEVTLALAGMLDLDVMIARVNPGAESMYIISMFIGEAMKGNLEIPLKNTPFAKAIEERRLQVVESGDCRLFPAEAQVTQEGRVESCLCLPVFDRRGDVSGVIAVFGRRRVFSGADIKILETIGHIVAAEFELLEKTVSLDNILNSSIDTAIISTDLDFRITYYNPAAEKFFGVTADEAIGMKLGQIGETEKLALSLPATVLNDVRKKGESRFSHEITRGNEVCHIDSRIYGMLDPNSRLVGFVLMSRDITSYRRLEEELLHSRKLEAVGLLAGGMAHEFNNILMTIMGYSSLLSIKTGETDPRKPYVENILESSERAASLIRSMLTFSRKQIINPRIVNVNDIVRRIDNLVRSVLEEDIELKTSLPDAELVVTADSGQIEQVLMNMLTNARDAMPNGGRIMIETGQEIIGEGYAKAMADLAPGRYATISISDTGIGMDEATREHIFEPFFTNKDAGKGTGLGLSIAFGIIKQHGGHINVNSDPGRGSSFTIYLPMESELKAQEIFNTVSAQPTMGAETILVVEDDPNVIDFVRDFLTEFGYTVLCADSGNALQLFGENRGRIDLLLLDVVMPKKSGREIYDEIREIRPDIGAIFMSGYSTEIILKRGALDEGHDFIHKPISPETLLNKIREILDRKPGGPAA
jgi:PAS domain S-box-containing protein